MAQLKPCATITPPSSLHATEHVLFNRFWKSNTCSFKEFKPKASVGAGRLQVSVRCESLYCIKMQSMWSKLRLRSRHS
ncbi:argininosuccinate synthase [Trifolium pratense]|uniref:Argininosuccinate synthase n=1 Tax=Trifolium pratense TaxID=57577 RepID=A0A2K3JXP6_TRIPR|nr:argininosuccinate synthase [Trifolium pratense]